MNCESWTENCLTDPSEISERCAGTGFLRVYDCPINRQSALIKIFISAILCHNLQHCCIIILNGPLEKHNDELIATLFITKSFFSFTNYSLNLCSWIMKLWSLWEVKPPIMKGLADSRGTTDSLPRIQVALHRYKQLLRSGANCGNVVQPRKIRSYRFLPLKILLPQ